MMDSRNDRPCRERQVPSRTPRRGWTVVESQADIATVVYTVSRMPDACPHCGRPLPVVVDAFCPDCRRPLDEPPRVVGVPGPSGPGRARSLLGLLVAAGGLFGMFAAVSAAVQGRVADAAY